VQHLPPCSSVTVLSPSACPDGMAFCSTVALDES
jgi:hypothetical protein